MKPSHLYHIGQTGRIYKTCNDNLWAGDEGDHVIFSFNCGGKMKYGSAMAD